MPLRVAGFGLVWGLLWAWGYGPADYPVRLAVQTFGHPVRARLPPGSGPDGDGLFYVAQRIDSGVVIKDKTTKSATYVPGWDRFLALDLASVWTVHRLAVGFPFSPFDHYVTGALAFLLIWRWFPAFLGWEPTRLRAGAFRIPLRVLQAADVAVAACALLGASMYSAAHVWITAAVWFALRLARLKGYVMFVRLLPPVGASPRLALPGSENAPVRPDRKVPHHEERPASLLASTTPNQWSKIPAGAIALGFLILAFVQMRNRLVSVPEPGYHVLGLALPHWQAISWSLIAFAAVVAIREFLVAWRQTDDL